MVDAVSGVCAFGKNDQAFLREQKQRAGLVGVVRRNEDLRSARKVLQGGNGVAVQAERFVVDGAGGDQRRVVGFVEAVQIRSVLEVVRVEVAVLEVVVRQNVVVVGDDLERVALGGEVCLHLFKDLGVRRGARSDADGLAVAAGASCEESRRENEDGCEENQ